MPLLEFGDRAGESVIIDVTGRAGRISRRIACRVARCWRNTLDGKSICQRGRYRGIDRRSWFHVFRDLGDWLPATLGDDSSPALQLFAQSRVVVVGRAQGRQRPVELPVPRRAWSSFALQSRSPERPRLKSAFPEPRSADSRSRVSRPPCSLLKRRRPVASLGRTLAVASVIRRYS